MKKSSELSALLGIAQRDMGQLLNVHRSQWAMFEVGKRKLPDEAKLLLAEMLAHLEKETTAKRHTETLKQDPKVFSFLVTRLQENNRKRAILNRRLDVVKRKYIANTKVLSLMAFLATHERQKSVTSQAHLKSLAVRADNALAKNNPSVALLYETELKLLEGEHQLLEEFLKEHTGNTKTVM